MDNQPEALLLADELERYATTDAEKQAAAELRRLHQHELANNEWGERTQWVQDTCKPHELGMHRADVLKSRIAALEKALALYADVNNWSEDANGVLRCWMEPDISTPEQYAGFDTARQTLKVNA